MSVFALAQKLELGLVFVEKLLLCVLFWVLIVVIAVQVICRYWLYIPTPWAEEVARFTFVWVVYVGASVATFHREHITIDVAHPLYGMLFRIRDPRRIERFLILVNFILVVPFLAYLTYLNGQYLSSIARLGQLSPAVHINMLIPMSAILVGSGLMLLHAITDCLRGYAKPEARGEELLI